MVLKLPFQRSEQLMNKRLEIWHIFNNKPLLCFSLSFLILFGFENRGWDTNLPLNLSFGIFPTCVHHISSKILFGAAWYFVDNIKYQQHMNRQCASYQVREIGIRYRIIIFQIFVHALDVSRRRFRLLHLCWFQIQPGNVSDLMLNEIRKLGQKCSLHILTHGKLKHENHHVLWPYRHWRNTEAIRQGTHTRLKKKFPKLVWVPYLWRII